MHREQAEQKSKTVYHRPAYLRPYDADHAVGASQLLATSGEACHLHSPALDVKWSLEVTPCRPGWQPRTSAGERSRSRDQTRFA